MAVMAVVQMFGFPSLLDVQDPAPDLLVADLEQSTSASWHWTGNRNSFWEHNMYLGMSENAENGVQTPNEIAIE